MATVESNNRVVRGNRFMLFVTLDATDNDGNVLPLPLDAETWHVKVRSVVTISELAVTRIHGENTIVCDVPANKLPCGTYSLEASSGEYRFAEPAALVVVEYTKDAGLTPNAEVEVRTVHIHGTVNMGGRLGIEDGEVTYDKLDDELKGDVDDSRDFLSKYFIKDATVHMDVSPYNNREAWGMSGYYTAGDGKVYVENYIGHNKDVEALGFQCPIHLDAVEGRTYTIVMDVAASSTEERDKDVVTGSGMGVNLEDNNPIGRGAFVQNVSRLNFHEGERITFENVTGGDYTLRLSPSTRFSFSNWICVRIDSITYKDSIRRPQVIVKGAVREDSDRPNTQDMHDGELWLYPALSNNNSGWLTLRESFTLRDGQTYGLGRRNVNNGDLLAVAKVNGVARWAVIAIHEAKEWWDSTTNNWGGVDGLMSAQDKGKLAWLYEHIGDKVNKSEFDQKFNALAQAGRDLEATKFHNEANDFTGYADLKNADNIWEPGVYNNCHWGSPFSDEQDFTLICTLAGIVDRGNYITRVYHQTAISSLDPASIYVRAKYRVTAHDTGEVMEIFSDWQDIGALITTPRIADGAVTPDKLDRTYLTEHQSLADYATTEQVRQAIASLVNSAPEALDTLGELAAALQSHEDAYDALLTVVGGKADLDYVNNSLTSLSSGLTGYIENKTTTATADEVLALLN